MTSLLSGAALLLLVFCALYGMTARSMGWREAAVMWLFSVGLTALVVIGIVLFVTGWNTLAVSP